MSNRGEPAAYHRRIWMIAERRPRRAVALALSLYERTADAPAVERAWAAYTCGLAQIAWERLGPARDHLAEALALFEQCDHQDGRLRCRHLLLTIDHLSGVGPRLQENWRALAADYEAVGDHLGTARVRMNQAAHLNVLERSMEALDLVSEVADVINSSGTPAEQARLLRIAAIAQTSAGRVTEAGILIEHAIATYISNRLDIEVAKCWMQRGWLNVRLEQLSSAQKDLRSALMVLQHHDLVLNMAVCHKDIGLIEGRLGRYPAALSATMQARAAFELLNRQDFIARCDLHIGIVAYYSGLFDLALACYKRAESSFARHGAMRLAQLAQRNTALALRAQGRAISALAVLRVIERQAGDAADRLELAEILTERARAQRDLGQDELSLAVFEHAEQLFTEVGNGAAAAECRFEQAWLYLAAGDYQRAERLYRAARPPLSDRPAHHWRIDYGLARCAEQRGAAFEALSYYRQASTTVSTLRQQIASEHASSGLFAQARQLFDAALRHVVGLDDSLATLELIEQQRAVALQSQLREAAFGFHGPNQRGAYEQVRARLQPMLEQPGLSAESDAVILEYLEQLLQARHYAHAGDEQPLQALDLPTLRSQLDSAFPAGWTALIYAFCDDQLLIVTLDQRGATLDQIPLEGDLLRRLKRAVEPAYRRLIYLDVMRLMSPGQPPWGDLEALSRLLLPEAVRQSLTPEHRLLIVPAGYLHALPWPALRLENAWLCERCIPQIIPSLTLWPLLDSRRPDGDALLFVGCSEFGVRAPALPNVRSEHELVASLWRGPHAQLLDATASAAHVRDLAETGALQRYRALHIASHAHLFAGRGLLAHIKLWESDLILDEVAQLALAGALVVLATCDGAASEALDGEELLGLGRALLAAGARDVVASLWPTYDLQAQELWSHFYYELGHGRDPAEALAFAQRNLAQRYRLGMDATDPASPLIWGGFSLLGAGTRV